MYIAGVLLIILFIAVAASRSNDNRGAVPWLGLLGGIFLALFLFTTHEFMLTAGMAFVGSLVFAMIPSRPQT